MKNANGVATATRVQTGAKKAVASKKAVAAPVNRQAERAQKAATKELGTLASALTSVKIELRDGKVSAKTRQRLASIKKRLKNATIAIENVEKF